MPSKPAFTLHRHDGLKDGCVEDSLAIERALIQRHVVLQPHHPQATHRVLTLCRHVAHLTAGASGTSFACMIVFC